jgi:hypothetical protein
MAQNYVSDRLTHFVGRGRKREEQYQLMVKILKEGRLRAGTGTVGEEAKVQLDLNLRGQWLEQLGEIGRLACICFCDIPLDSMSIHMDKYSSFGISFLKPFLAEKGANPVHYVAKNSIATEFHPPNCGCGVKPQMARQEHFKRQCIPLYDNLVRLTFPAGLPTPGQPPPLTITVDGPGLQQIVFFAREVLGRVKCFDHTLPENHPDNYYMEREWRVHGHVTFTLADVVGLIAPPECHARLRADVPMLAGDIRFPRLPASCV